MADLLLFWINHELQLSQYVTDMEHDFASGYLLGEILFRLNQQPNFASFLKSSLTDAKIHNFCYLERSLRGLHIPFNSTIASAIMNEKPGAVANVLYQIKMASDRLARGKQVSMRSADRTGVVPLPNLPTKLPKPAYDSEMHRAFEHAIRRHAKSMRSLKDEKEHADAVRDKEQAYREQTEAKRQQLEITKAERLHQAFIHSQFIKVALDETDSPAWRMALQKKHEREDRKARFYKQLLQHRAQQQRELTFSLKRQVQEDLDAFERDTLHKPRTPSAHIPTRKSVGYGLRSLTSALATADATFPVLTSTTSKPRSFLLPEQRKKMPLTTPSDNKDLVTARSPSMDDAPKSTDLMLNTDTIRAQKQARERRKEQFDRRRKRFLQECSFQQTQSNRMRLDATLLNTTLRQTNAELDARAQMDHILAYKQIAMENRRLREAQYANRRELDQQDAVARDQSMYQSFHERYHDDVTMHHMQAAQATQAVSAAAHYANQVMATSVMHELVDFVVLVAGMREDSMHTRDAAVFLAPDAWTELQVLFANGMATTKENQDQSSELLDAYRLEEYLASLLPFHSTDDGSSLLMAKKRSKEHGDTQFWGALEPLDEHIVLGEAVKYLRWIARVIVPRLESSSASQSTAVIETVYDSTESDDHQPLVEESSAQKLRVLFFGPPFSGKSTQARLLAEKYNLRLISVQELLQQAVSGTAMDDVSRQIQTLLQSGQEIPTHLLCMLVYQAIQTPVESTTNGWIVWDLPGTAEAGQYLEELLTNFVDPSQIPSPYDFASSIAPGASKPKLPASFLYGKSGIDLVFYLNCANDLVLERCLGYMEDAATHEPFHLVYNPPSDTSIDRHRLQQVNHSVHAAELLSLQANTQQQAAAALKQWFQRFNTLREVQLEPPGLSSHWTPNETHQLIVNMVEARSQDQAQYDKQLDAEREEAELIFMMSEEHRTLHLLDLERQIAAAQTELQQHQRAVQQAEESKVKKEEIAELRLAMDRAHQFVEQTVGVAKDWFHREIQTARQARRAYCGTLLPPLATVLAASWDAMEDEYVRVMKKSFSMLRTERTAAATRTQHLLDQFCQFLRRLDRRQSIVNRFQQQFNDVLEEMRFDEASKIELHARVDVLQDDLLTMMATKQAESEDELNSMLRDGWMEDTCQFIALVCQMALQAECDRFRVSLQVLVDCFHAASEHPSLLTDGLEQLRAAKTLSDLPCRVFYDPSTSSMLLPDDSQTSSNPDLTTAAAAAAAPPAKGKAGKGAAKASVAAVPPVASGPTELFVGVMTDAATIHELLLSYDDVLQRCDALVTILTAPPAPPASTSTTVSSTGTQSNSDLHAASNRSLSSSSSSKLSIDQDKSLSNMIKGIKYEHMLMTRRVRYLRELAQDACDQITRSLRAVETTLRSALVERKAREEAAAAALVMHIRSTIEAERDLPCFINAQPNVVYRFPATIQLREDTIIRVESTQRLLPRPPIPPPPVIEPHHPILLNERQRNQVLEALCPPGATEWMPACAFIDIMERLTSQPHVLPVEWYHVEAKDVVFACMGAHFALRDGLVNVHTLVDAWTTDEALFRQFMDDEAA